MSTTDVPAPDADEHARLEWALQAEREYRTRYAHRDGVLDRCSGLPFNPMAHSDHHAPVLWAGNPIWQAAYARTNWKQLYLETYRAGWMHGGKGHVLWLKKIHFPPQPEGWHSITFEDGRGYAWYPIEATSGYKVKCDACGAVGDQGWCSDLPLGGGEMRCQTCVQVTSEEQRAAKGDDQ